jgi:large subunit ribosomal protein L10
VPTQKKIDTVQEMADQIARSNIAISGDYRGLTVAEITALRKSLHEAGVDFRVVKNTLFRRAASDADRAYMADLIEGPSAVMFAYDDPVQPAKALTEYIRTSRIAFAIKRGAMDGQMLSAADIQNLATLPSKEQLIGQVVGAIISPVATLSFLLSSALREFAGLVDARSNQMGGESEAAAS